MIFALQYSEFRSRHDQMLVTSHVANTAIAFVKQEVRWRLNLETNPPAMTTAFMYDHNHYSTGNYFIVHTAIMLFAGIA
jgi:hypothetical protein